MRRGTMLACGVLVLCTVLPQSASARPRNLPDALFGIISEPIDAIFGTVGRIGRPLRHRRPPAARSMPARTKPAPSKPTPAKAVRSKPATAAAPAGKATPVASPAAETVKAAAPAAHHTTEKATLSPTAATAAAMAPGAVAAGASAAAAPTAAPGGSAAIPVPAPAPRLRGVSLGQPGETRHGRGNASPQSLRLAVRPPPEPSPLGVVGPLVWPSAYEDIIGFTLWPKAYGERLRVHGIGDVLAAIFTRATSPASMSRGETARAMADNSRRASVASVGSIRPCNGAVQASVDWPANKIEHSTALTAEQRRALDQFRASIAEAIATISATCHDEAATTPVERLHSMQTALWAVHDAATLIRTPLANFYGSLTDDQKKQFIVPASQANLRATAMKDHSINQKEIAGMCGMLMSDKWPMRQIERALRPTNAQRASLEALQKKLFEMGQFLMASCLQPMPSTPTARLDSATDRLTAVIFAASNVSLALNDFYNQLSEQQKEKFTSVTQ